MPIRDPELEIKRPAKHVEACVEGIQDRGSTPLASTFLITNDLRRGMRSCDHESDNKLPVVRDDLISCGGQASWPGVTV